MRNADPLVADTTQGNSLGASDLCHVEALDGLAAAAPAGEASL